MSETQEYPTPTYLAERNPHIRDKDISFEEGPHIYTVLGDRGGYTSVTTWNHHHFAQFDADKIISNIFSSRFIIFIFIRHIMSFYQCCE